MKVLLFFIGASLVSFGNSSVSRKLQTVNPLLPVYSGNLNISFSKSLGCGACINGGYTYCVPGKLGSDPGSWSGFSDMCCKDKSSCAGVKAPALYTCSS